MRESNSKSENKGVLRINQLTELIIGAAIEVHRNTGPGLLESVYEECLCYELSQLGLKFQRQVELPVAYKIKLNCAFKMEMVVEDAVVSEIKTVDQLHPIHSAQLLTCLKLSGKKTGLPINFHEPVLKKGLKRLANGAPDTAPARPSAPSAPSALSGFDCFSSQRLRASVVKK